MRSFFLSVLLATVFGVSSAHGQRFPFVIGGNDSTDTITNRRGLLDVPAGKDGFVREEGGHFFAGEDRIRFWGMNLCFPANFPTHDDADQIAPHLAKLGINAVRFHHMDMQEAPSGIWTKVNEQGKRELDPAMVDRLDYFLAKLHENGIYADMNLHVSRTLSPEEGYPQLSDVPWWASFNKWVMYYDRDVQAEVKRYCRDLLTHKNPYRDNMARVDDPGIALVEMLNENYFSQQGYSLYRKLPQRFQDSLTLAWNQWLAKKYGDHSAMVRSWTGQQPAMGELLVDTATFSDSLDGWKVTRTATELPRTFGVESSGDLGDALKAIRFEPLEATDQTHHLQLMRDGLSVQKNVPLTLSYWVRADGVRTYNAELSTAKGGQWRDVGIFETLEASPKWQRVTRALFPGETVDNEVGLRFSFGNSAIPIELAGITLREGSQALPMPEDQSLKNQNIGIPAEGSFIGAHADMKQFMIDTEVSWVAELKSFLTDELGVKVPITASQINYHTPEVNERLNDFVDLHNYWHHPMFPSGGDWDSKRWTVGNDPIEADPTRSSWPANSLLMRTGWRYADKPMTMTEWNYPEPSPYSAGCVAMAAVIASLQDWDAVFFFEYDSNSKDTASWNRDQTNNFFSFNGQPVKLANFSVFANLFLRGDLAPLQRQLTSPVGEPLPGELGLSYRLGVSPSVDRTPAYTLPDATQLSTPDGSVIWRSSPPTTGYLQLNTPATQGVWGTIGGQSFDVGGVELSIDELDPNYATVILTSIGGEPIATSSRSLLLASTSSENADMIWNADHTSVGEDWGHGPTSLLGLTATVRLSDPNGNIRVYALDSKGNRTATIAVRHDGAKSEFTISPDDQTLWYEVAR